MSEEKMERQEEVQIQMLCGFLLRVRRVDLI